MKLLFTDLDGTLLRDDKTISETLHDALFDWIKKGHKLILSSGRPLGSIEQVQRELNLTIPGVYISANNGSLLYDCANKKAIMEKTVSLDDVSAVMAEALKRGIHCHTYNYTHILTSHHTKALDYYREHIHLPFEILSDVREALPAQGPYKLVSIDLEDHAKLESFQNAIAELSNHRLTSIFSNDKYLEIFNAQSGKGNGVQALCDYLGVSIEDAIAVGDAENDLSMIEVAGVGVAMQNASSFIKEKANLVTKTDNNHDGLLSVIKDFINL